MIIGQNFPSLGPGSTKRLRTYQALLMQDWDKRHFDAELCELARQYSYTWALPEYNDEVAYLRDLRSTKDGKYFSQGVKEYAKVLKGVEAFTEPNHVYGGWNRHYKAAKKYVMDHGPERKLLPLVYTCDEDIANVIPRKDTHAGFAFVETGKREKGDYLDGIFKKYEQEEHKARMQKFYRNLILIAVRTQGNGHAYDEDGNKTNDCDHKTRVVSMITIMLILMELRFAKGVQDFMAEVDWYAGGKNLDIEVAQWINSHRIEYRFWCTLDYSSFDSSISAWLIHDAFEIMRSWFTLSPDDEELFILVEKAFIEKDFVIGEGIVHSVKGVPSGSMFTQIVDSIVNRLMILTYAFSHDLTLEMIIMGDDNLIFCNSHIDIEDLAGYLRRMFGVTINPAKTVEGDRYKDPVFLSRIWTPGGCDRETHELVAKMLYPERDRKYGKDHGTPAMTFYAYFLCYPVAMRRIFDVPRFLSEHPEVTSYNLKTLDSQNLPGIIRYLQRYSGGYWSR